MKKVKGMTLVELVVAIAILSVASLMLLMAMQQVSMINRETHQMNERISEEIKIAENESQTNASASSVTNGEVTIKVLSGGGATTGTYKMDGHTIYIQGTTKSHIDDGVNFKYFVTDEP